jgi:hypothetical protein
MIIRARDDDRCTASYCDAPIQRIDRHIGRTGGGPTSIDNGQGKRALHNHVAEIGISRRSGRGRAPDLRDALASPDGPRYFTTVKINGRSPVRARRRLRVPPSSSTTRGA